MRNLLSLFVLLAAACGPVRTADPVVDTDAGTTDAGTTDAGTTDAGTTDAGTTDAGTAGAIDAPADAWTYQPFPDAHCGNGTETGIGVNLHPGAKTLVVFLAGGGACWEVGACYVLKTAVHVEDTVQSAVVLAEAKAPAMGLLFDRTVATNPLKDASFAYVPYCTADLHAGTRVQRYEALGQVRDLHHEGAKNLEAYLKRLVPSAPGVERVVLVGVSAGGYGALMNRWRVERAFGPNVRVDVLDDSGIPVAMAWDRFGTAMAAWGTEWPEGCTDCKFEKLLADDAKAGVRAHRTALFAYRRDGTISAYFGIQGTDIEAGLDAQKATLAAHQKFFLLDGSGHVLLSTPAAKTSGGQVVGDWLRAFLTDDAGWASVGP